MTDNVKTQLDEFDAPYGRKIRLDEIAYESGLTLMRVTIREGARYTLLEIDRDTARRWGAAMRSWATES